MLLPINLILGVLSTPPKAKDTAVRYTLVRLMRLSGQTQCDWMVKQVRLRNLAALLKSSEFENDSLWVASTDPDLLPSSCLWTEANSNISTEAMLVAYAGGVG